VRFLTVFGSLAKARDYLGSGRGEFTITVDQGETRMERRRSVKDEYDLVFAMALKIEDVITAITIATRLDT
jgi:hypothetical protein